MRDGFFARDSCRHGRRHPEHARHHQLGANSDYPIFANLDEARAMFEQLICREPRKPAARARPPKHRPRRNNGHAARPTSLCRRGPEDRSIRIEHGPTPSPRPGEVLIKVSAAGLNRADLLQRKGLYPPRRTLRLSWGWRWRVS